MKRQYISIVALIMLFSCSGNAENKTPEIEVVKVQETKKETVLKEKVTPEVVLKEETLLVKKEVSKEEVKEEILPVEQEKKKEVVEKLPPSLKTLPNHKVWDALLREHVSSVGNVDYKAMKSSIEKIKSYLKYMDDVSLQSDWSKNEKLAYWINLYNASTVYLIASNYPVASITKLSGGKPWDKKFVKSGGKVYSLNEIENSIVRPKFKDPRIHAALNCAAKSCPKLLNAAYAPSKLDIQLDAQSKAWVNDKSKNQLSPTKLKVSKIFEWYGDDFKSAGGVIGFINKYKNAKMMITPKAKVAYLEYDWSLNE